MFSFMKFVDSLRRLIIVCFQVLPSPGCFLLIYIIRVCCSNRLVGIWVGEKRRKIRLLKSHVITTMSEVVLRRSLPLKRLRQTFTLHVVFGISR